MPEPADIRTSLRMPQSLHEHLSRAAEANRHSFSDEIRQRLIASFDRPAVPSATDPRTQALLEAIFEIAYGLSEWFPAWYEDPFAARVLRLAVDKLLQALEPEGEPVMKPRPGTFTKMFSGSTVESLSGVLAGLAVTKLAGRDR
jgi:AcrR family transcriptional regulator